MFWVMDLDILLVVVTFPCSPSNGPVISHIVEVDGDEERVTRARD